ncbi:HD-GYP domain-containing protein [Ornithinibacillus bavariensis]|nr:HD-GYP domain-containing protein [Ornithinibacillus bavariensis]
MMKQSLHLSLIQEEKRATIWFLWLFYIVFFVYDIFYNFLLPNTPWNAPMMIITKPFDYVLYIIMIALLPFSFYLIKTNNPKSIKYIYFICYIVLNIARDIWVYEGKDVPYSSGNLVEIVMVLFCPIFVNKTYFYLVSGGVLLKYIIIGSVIRDSIVILPLLIVIILSIISYIILHRFMSYLEAVKQEYDNRLEGIVKAIIQTLEMKDPYTRGHSERVAEYALSLAKATGSLNKEELRYYYFACLLHDVGKIRIPDAILTKPGKLTKEEFDLIKQHPVIGAKAVEDVVEISNNLGVILHHHERWDGKGYPNGLKEKEIPFLARITSIADAFDAMTSSRAYRDALTNEVAYNRILEGKGTQFDPELVDIFIQVYPTWEEIHYKQHHEQTK